MQQWAGCGPGGIGSAWGTAALLTGTLGELFGLVHAYWAVSTWILILQGLAPTRTIWRGLEHLTGTRVGLGRCNTSTHPHALWLVGATTVLTFLIKPLLVRNCGSMNTSMSG